MAQKKEKKGNKFGLTDLQERFCQEYLKDLNATAAYKRAGSKANENSARVDASRMLTNANIQSRFSQLVEERSKRTQITADRVLQEIAKIAFANMGFYAEFDADGVTLKSSSELTEEQLAVIESVSEVPLKAGGKALKIKLHDKTRNLEMLMRHLGLFNDKLNLAGKHNINFIVTEPLKQKPEGT